MIKLIVGKKGTGKTKLLVELVHQAAESSKGNVVCIEKGDSLTYDIKPSIRLIRAEEYGVDNYTTMAGFICGIMAGDYDCTDIFVDSITKLCGKDTAAMVEFFHKMKQLTDAHNLTLTSTVSADQSDLPEELKPYIEERAI